jgi:hypothetical protein
MLLKLIVEKPAPEEQFEYILEEKDRQSPSTLYIKGPYMRAEEKNRNNRSYPLSELTREVERYRSEMINNNRAMGELNHPTNAEVDLERACHMVTEIVQEGNTFYGKSKVLTTPCGQIVRSLINDGVKVGMSSRALGQLVEGSGCNRVQNMRLVAIDCVADPSFPKAFVNGILESKQWVCNDSNKFEEIYNQFENTVSNLPKKDVENFLLESVLNFINKIKGRI